MDRAFSVYTKSSPWLPRFSPILHSRSFIILHFTFRSMIHFKLIFVKCARSASSLVCLFFYLFSCECPVVSIPFVEVYPVFIELPLLSSQRSVDYICVGLFLGSLFCSIDLSILLLISHCLDYCSFIVSLDVRECQSSNFVLLF